ncbi:hypothetical protein M9979_05050 [Sphingomonas sp. RP10(2022)]|uniref:Uncharacterized protein n=1 Tax=Sphingomonas liriopis TaxID=2949094 RepID=A0A9X2HNH8_9SPHN|nr:hypothetical protein [Sphingomonas liriopis]MCP3734243.1 hypothetical protein [Sphingomonas liriopis]
MTFRRLTIAAASIALCASPLAAQETAPPATTTDAAPAIEAAPAPPIPAKRSMAEKIAIATGMLTAGIAAFKSLKQPKPAEPAAPTEPVAQAAQ